MTRRFTVPASLNIIPCVNCQAAGLTLIGEGQAQCRFCQTLNTFNERICAECETVNAPKADICATCSTPLRKACPNCGESNWNGHTTCQECGQSLDSLSNVLTRAQQHRAGRQGFTPAEAAAIKAQEEADSQKRLAYFNELEQQRRDQLSVAKSRRAREERIMLWVIVGVVGIIAVGVGVVVVMYGIR